MSKNQKNNNKYLLFLISLLFLTSFLSIRTLKKVNPQDIKIYGSKLFSEKNIFENSSTIFPTPLILVNTKYLEKELKKNLSLKNVSVRRQIFPFGLRIFIETRTPIAYGERLKNTQKIKGFIDEDGFFIEKQNVEKVNLENLNVQVFGWQEKFSKTISKILTSQKNREVELVRISFSPNGFLTLEERDLKTILLGFNPDLIKFQLLIINNLKDELERKNFSKKIDNIDLTDPNNPKIKVFKP